MAESNDILDELLGDGAPAPDPAAPAAPVDEPAAAAGAGPAPVPAPNDDENKVEPPEGVEVVDDMGNYETKGGF